MLWQSQEPFHLAKNASTIQYGYRKCGTHAQVFSKNTLSWELQEWNKTKRQKKKVRREEWVYMESSKMGQKEKKEVPTA